MVLDKGTKTNKLMSFKMVKLYFFKKVCLQCNRGNGI